MQHSKHYRDDGKISIPDHVQRYLDEHFLGKLENMDVPHPKLMVVFSGGNAMGKSSISARIAKDLQGIVLSNDVVRHMLHQYQPDMPGDEVNRYMWQYMLDLYERLDTLTPNGLVVRDGVIDWYYDKLFPIFEARGYQRFIIGFDIPRAMRAELVKKRGDTNVAKVDDLLEMLDDLIRYEKDFRKIHKPDYMLTASNLFDHDKVLTAIQKRLDQLT